MTRRVSIRHRIEIDHGEPTAIPTHWAHLRPAPAAASRIRAYTMCVEPPSSFVNWVRDPLQNHLARIDLPEPAARLAITVEVVADLEPINPFDFLLEPDAGRYPFAYAAALQRDLAPYMTVPAGGRRFQDWAAALEREPADVLERLTATTRQVRHAIAVEPSSARGAVDLDAVLSSATASPWALAWLLTLGLRSLGFAARFVSGYVVGPGTAVVPVDLRAWTDVFLPGAGWVGIDPLTELFANETYIALAAAPDPRRTQPLISERDSPSARRTEHLHGRALEKIERSAPYTRSERAEIDQLTRGLDADLATAGLRFSVRREIAVVSAAARDAPEWTYAALGDDKLAGAQTLLQRLRERLDPAGVPMRAQGQWYAGEPLPRWKLLYVYRADGMPLWNQGNTSAADDRPALSIEAVKVCAEEIARRLGVAASSLRPVYEDPLCEKDRMESARGGPPPRESLTDPAQRLALAQRLCARPASPAGYVLPLHRRHTAGWRSGPWDLRRGEVYLSPGESALGLRLPLDSLPPPPVPKVSDEEPPENTAADDVPRTALCFERRDGRLHIFLPPVDDYERFVDLIAKIDAALTALAIPAVLEGYGPPDDTRLRQVVLEPDIGVLRIALPEASSWSEHAEILRIAYHQCAQLGLVPYGVSEDGHRVPVRSCAPLSMRGGDALENPFLRRPELLRRLIRCWQEHPSLSYLFATRPLEPEGGSVRGTDARIGAAYELALGLERLTQGGASQPGRVLQHLLADGKLDVRKAELRVDEITGPDAAAAARGRVVLRSFDTPADATMATLQALLVAALLAQSSDHAGYFEDPNTSRDRFLLPQPLWDDLCVLLADLEHAGYRLRREWFRPFLDVHFPILGEVRMGDLALELREAHEPQPVLAEEVVGGGPVRFVDVANERIQVRATGLTPLRHALLCNGRLVPLQSTRTSGELICGIRYKARTPPVTLHPTVPPVEELVLDLVDLWTRKRLGGCTYRPSARGATLRFSQSAAPAALPGGLLPVDLGPFGPVTLRQSIGAGRFLAHGSAPDAPFAILPGTAGPYVLDLTVVG